MTKKGVILFLTILIMLIIIPGCDGNGEGSGENDEDSSMEEEVTMYTVEINEKFKELLESYPDEKVEEGTRVRFVLKEKYQEIFNQWYFNGEERGQGLEISYTVEEDLTVDGEFDPFLHVKEMEPENQWDIGDPRNDLPEHFTSPENPVLENFQESMENDKEIHHFQYQEQDYLLAKERNPGDEGDWVREIELFKANPREEGYEYELVHSVELSDLGFGQHNPGLISEISNNDRYLYITIDYIRLIHDEHWQAMVEDRDIDRYVPESNFLQVFDLLEKELTATYEDFVDQPLSTYNLVPLGKDEMILASDNEGWWRLNTKEVKADKLEIGGPYRHTKVKTDTLETLRSGSMWKDNLLFTLSGENPPICGYHGFLDLWYITDEALELLATTGEMTVMQYDDELRELWVIAGTQQEPKVIIYEINEPAGDQGALVTKVEDLDQIDFIERKKTFQNGGPLVTFDEGGAGLLVSEYFPFDGFGMILIPMRPGGHSNHVYAIENEDGKWDKLHLFGLEETATQGQWVYMKIEDRILRFDRTELIKVFHEAMGMDVEREEDVSEEDIKRALQEKHWELASELLAVYGEDSVNQPIRWEQPPEDDETMADWNRDILYAMREGLVISESMAEGYIEEVMENRFEPLSEDVLEGSEEDLYQWFGEMEEWRQDEVVIFHNKFVTMNNITEGHDHGISVLITDGAKEMADPFAEYLQKWFYQGSEDNFPWMHSLPYVEVAGQDFYRTASVAFGPYRSVICLLGNPDRLLGAEVKSDRVIFTIESEGGYSVGKGIYELIYEIDVVEKGKYAIRGYSYEKVDE